MGCGRGGVRGECYEDKLEAVLIRPRKVGELSLTRYTRRIRRGSSTPSMEYALVPPGLDREC